MPSEHPFGHAARSGECQNALVVARAIDIGNLLVIISAIISARVDHLEKICRWKLLVIADHNELLCSRYRSQRILWRDLACFVDYENIKGQFAGSQKLSDG